MTTAQQNITNLTQRIQELKGCYMRGEMTLDALLFSVTIAGVKEAESIYKAVEEKEMDEEAAWIKKNQMYQVRDEE